MLRFAKLTTILFAAVFVAVATGGALSYPIPGIEREGAKEIDKIELFFPRLPRVADLTSEGLVSIDWLTRTAAPPGVVYYGEYLPLREASAPVFTGTTAEPAGVPTELHRANFDIKPIATAAANGDGKKDVTSAVRYRVESYDPVKQRSRLWDGRFAFTRESGVFRRLPCVVLGPFVANVEDRSAVVWFETDLRTEARVLVRKAAARGAKENSFSVVPENPGLRHEIKITGLKPGNKYTYSVELLDSGKPGEVAMRLPDYDFKTAPAAATRGTKFTFAIMADSRSSYGGPEYAQDGMNVATFGRVIRTAHASGVEFVLFTGDLADGYTTSREDFENQVRTWFKTVEPVGRHIPFYIVPGNHETLVHWYSDGVFYDREEGDSTERVLAELIVNPRNGPDPERRQLPPYVETVYSFDYGSVHFVGLNTDYWYTKNPELVPGKLRGVIMENQLKWFEADVAAAKKKGAKEILVFAHEPAFPNGGHVGDAMWYGGKKPEVLAMRDRFLGIVAKAGIRAVFFAHEHNYSRTVIDGNVHPAFKGRSPLTQITSGGAGAPPVGREPNTPWAEAVRSFYAGDHFVLVTVDTTTGAASFKAVTPAGVIVDSGKF